MKELHVKHRRTNKHREMETKTEWTRNSHELRSSNYSEGAWRPVSDHRQLGQPTPALDLQGKLLGLKGVGAAEVWEFCKHEECA